MLRAVAGPLDALTESTPDDLLDLNADERNRMVRESISDDLVGSPFEHVRLYLQHVARPRGQSFETAWVEALLSAPRDEDRVDAMSALRWAKPSFHAAYEAMPAPMPMECKWARAGKGKRAAKVCVATELLQPSQLLAPEQLPAEPAATRTPVAA